jgi:hypothetical protein
MQKTNGKTWDMNHSKSSGKKRAAIVTKKNGEKSANW